MEKLKSSVLIRIDQQIDHKREHDHSLAMPDLELAQDQEKGKIYFSFFSLNLSYATVELHQLEIR